MQEARVALDGLENARFAVDYNGKTLTVLYCTSHAGCNAAAKNKMNPSGKYILSRTGTHSPVVVPTDAQRTGIHKPLLTEADNLLLGGQGPKQCLGTLQSRYKKSPEVLALLPTARQLKNKAHKLRKKGEFSITTYADLMLWASPRMCTTKEMFFQHMSYNIEEDGERILKQSFDYQNELLVLDTFSEKLDNGEISLAIIFTSRRLFRTGPRAIIGQQSMHRSSMDFLAATDDMYKLHIGGYTLVSFGTFGVHYGETEKYHQTFYPMAFIKAREKKGLLVEKESYDENIKTQLEYLSQARFASQFEALCALVVDNWITLGEVEYAQWLETEYLTEPWDLWFYSASDAPGVVPNQNPIESHHRKIKATAVSHLRAATGHVLAGTLPKILIANAMDIGTTNSAFRIRTCAF
ncbi:hypothetical protein F444_01269 [Phytophthora nicotianae P1976]|uniref:Uncharacterized protein n=1 Tax=Phytophthora nicotianae P1976 TaxID=1317066 RepID=A0A081B164_PHYNI|nr:hypothetical protein F444_01269 [Phytophthora nicotianae P1976]